MGILEKLATKVVEKVVAYKTREVAVDVCDKLGKKLDDVCDKQEKKSREKQNKKVDDFLCNETSHARLILTQKRSKFKEGFQVLDEKKEVKYVVKGKLFSSAHQLSVYDETGKNKMGEVNKKRIAIRSPFSSEQHPQDFVVKLGDKKVGTIKSRDSLVRPKFEFDFNKWVIEGNILGSKYTIKNGQEVVMEVCAQFGIKEDTYFIDIVNPETELLCLMVALAIDASSRQ